MTSEFRAVIHSSHRAVRITLSARTSRAWDVVPFFCPWFWTLYDDACSFSGHWWCQQQGWNDGHSMRTRLCQKNTRSKTLFELWRWSSRPVNGCEQERRPRRRWLAAFSSRWLELSSDCVIVSWQRLWRRRVSPDHSHPLLQWIVVSSNSSGAFWAYCSPQESRVRDQTDPNNSRDSS